MNRALALLGLALLGLSLPPPGYAQPTVRSPVVADWPAEAPPTRRAFVPAATQATIPATANELLPPTLQEILAAREDMQLAFVAVDLGLEDDNPFWQMSTTAMTVLLTKLARWDPSPVVEDSIWPALDDQDARYQGLLVLLQTKQGRRFEPFRVYRGRLLSATGEVITPDPGRALEYWLFGTARVRRDQQLGAQILPVYTFEQCRILGQRVVETEPRQCLLPDNHLMLETFAEPSLLSARMTSFEECLQAGEGLIYTFPRRCVAAGGKVFTEPPQVYDNLPR